MWVTAIVGVATKFYTASLAVMYRSEGSDGTLHGGPMYVIMEGMGKRWYPLAALFAAACLIGALPIFQANQFIQLLRDVVAIPAGWATSEQHFTFDLVASSVVALLVAAVVIGRIERIGKLTVRLVPSMVLLYLFMTLTVMFKLCRRDSRHPAVNCYRCLHWPSRSWRIHRRGYSYWRAPRCIFQ